MSTGVRGELLAAEKLVERGWSVSFPVDTSPYDLVAAKDDKVFRIQVKSTIGLKKYKGYKEHYQFQTGRGLHSKRRYENHEFDYYICVALDGPRFWVFPIGFSKCVTVKIYDSNERFKGYENAWDILETG